MIGAVTSSPFFPSSESRELADDVRELFDDLAATLDREQRAFSGECRPPLDVRETDEAVELTVDVAGVPTNALRVIFRSSIVLIVGEKAPSRTTADQTFHLVEREFGRFARAVKIAGAFDVERARAIVARGELTVVLPKIKERRGRAHRIPVSATGSSEPA
jgi:HSP20 family protein